MMVKLGPDERYTRLVRAFGKNPKASQPVGTKGFGSSGLYPGGKLFAVRSHKKRQVVKLPAMRVDDLVRRGEGTHWNPRGRG